MTTVLEQQQEQLVLQKSGKVVKVTHDEFADSPREWDNLCKMYCSHRNYCLGDTYLNKTVDTKDYNSWEEVEQALIENYGEMAFIEPISLYDHSIQQISMGISRGWDSGRVGFIFCTMKDACGHYGMRDKLTKPQLQNLLSIAQSEIRTYNQYLLGDVHCIELYDVYTDGQHTIEECTDSVCGFYFDDKYTPQQAIKEHFGLEENEYVLKECD